jgi:putative copper resistance protein D
MQWPDVLRWLQVASVLCVMGSSAALLLGGSGGGAHGARWRRIVMAAMPWFAGASLLLMCWLLAAQAVSVTGRTDAAWQWQHWRGVLEQTRFGTVWAWRQALGVALLMVLLGRRPLAARVGKRAIAAIALALAAAIAGAAAWAGHGAAVEPSGLATAAMATHMLAAGLWGGGLPAMALGLALAARHRDGDLRDWIARLLRRFSVLAAACVAVLVLSGLVAAYLFSGAPTEWPARVDEWRLGLFTALERFVAPLLSTHFGVLLLAKIALFAAVLGLAARVRWRWMPRLAQGDESWVAASRSVKAEAALVLVVLLLAAQLATTVPAAHDAMRWPLPFRLSIDASWLLPGVPVWVSAGACLIVAVPIWAAAGRRAAGLVAALAGAGIVMWALAVPAYPDTYRRSTVAYDAVSVARGMGLYGQQCVACHGAAGHGDGPLAATMQPRPPDLAEPHTALHTAGDIFSWLTHGKPNSPMPGFAGVMNEEQRWDVINFLRAFSAGYQARLLTSRVVPGQPWLGLPDIDFVGVDDRPGSLSGLRGRTVLLVFYTLPASQQRLSQLAQWHERLRAAGAELVAVPLPASRGQPRAPLPYRQAADGAEDAAAAYLLFRRTLSNPGRTIAGEAPEHMEFLLDRFGYARARWIPEPNAAAPGWDDERLLVQQIELLRREPRLRPPPDDHVH